MIGWSVELSEFDIRYQLRGAIKSQCLVDFSTELTSLPHLSTGWTLYVDGSSNKTTCGAGVILEAPDDMEAHEVMYKSDSRVMVGQINEEFEVKEPLLQQYYHAA